jgi:hypothetical protein
MYCAQVEEELSFKAQLDPGMIMFFILDISPDSGEDFCSLLDKTELAIIFITNKHDV